LQHRDGAVNFDIESVSVATAQHPRLLDVSFVPKAKRQPFLAALAVLALVAALVLSPDATAVEAASAFNSLRAPGQTGFVAGHRGDKSGAPENTLPALQSAIDSEVEFVETDLQLTSDGVVVLMHDWTLDRTTNGSGPVWSHSFADIAELDAGSWYSPEFRGTTIPTLDEFLSILRPSGKGAILELKGSWTADQVLIVTSQLFARGVHDRVILASFDLWTLKALRDVAPGIPRAIITRTVTGDPALLAAACDAVAIVTSQTFVQSEPNVVARIHDAGLGVLLYTLNDRSTWSQAVSLGVDGIITDNLHELDRWLSTGSASDPTIDE
jgi:glycerophosphoryl diester phosphodiesterase